ncbi:MAG: hypothetical protein Q4D38_01920 [Planctomycetia bacterium]|nr:hypothetical protein [Planctomycetia bacterium]
MNEYIIRFLMGGTTLVLVSVVGKQSVYLGGTLSALPMISGLFFLINILHKNNDEMMNQACGGMVGMIIGLFFFMTIYVSMKFGCRVNEAFAIGLIACLVLAGGAIFAQHGFMPFRVEI